MPPRTKPSPICLNLASSPVSLIDVRNSGTFGIPASLRKSVNVSSSIGLPSPAALNATNASQANASPTVRSDAFPLVRPLAARSVERIAVAKRPPSTPALTTSLYVSFSQSSALARFAALLLGAPFWMALRAVVAALVPSRGALIASSSLVSPFAAAPKPLPAAGNLLNAFSGATKPHLSATFGNDANATTTRIVVLANCPACVSDRNALIRPAVSGLSLSSKTLPASNPLP